MNKRQNRKMFFTGSVDVIEKPKVNIDATNKDAVDTNFQNGHGINRTANVLQKAEARRAGKLRNNLNSSLPHYRSGNCSTVGFSMYE